MTVQGKRRPIVREVKYRHTVADLMTRKVAVLRRDDALSIADEVMKQKRVRHMPVVDENDRLVGIVSQRDLFRGALVEALAFAASPPGEPMKTLLVKEVMQADVETTRPDASLGEAARLMVRKKIGCLPVVKDGKVIAILTESDFVGWAARRNDC
jgi:acetoin utilization protein AcuB